jgi:hypothetical protein
LHIEKPHLRTKLGKMKKYIRIATVYKRDCFENFMPCKMDTIRWLRISESLANIGYKVDMIINTSRTSFEKNPNLRLIPFSDVDWNQYDIIKTLFHMGFESLHYAGGDNHPFIISKLGSVVGGSDNTEGVHFLNEERESLYETQKQISQKSKYITVLTEPSKLLWEREFGQNNTILMVPTGVDREIPPPCNNPYKEFSEKIVVYIGNIYQDTQKEINLLWQNRLNILGSLLKKKGIRLCFIGVGNVDKLDQNVVTYLGAVENDRIWDYQYFADVGIILAQGKVQHNESSKIYYYLRTGLPEVSEAPIPNNYLIKEADLGFVADYADNQMMAEMIEAAIYKKWQKEEAIRYILKNHTWDKRVQIYDTLIRKEFDLGIEESC